MPSRSCPHIWEPVPQPPYLTVQGIDARCSLCGARVIATPHVVTYVPGDPHVITYIETPWHPDIEVLPDGRRAVPLRPGVDIRAAIREASRILGERPDA